MYSVEYTPRVRGRHHLLISVDDQPISGSPFTVLVKIPPTKLGKPVRVIRGIKYPKYMAFNSSEELIVTEHGGDVLVFDKKGEQIRSISKSKHGFGRIHGVAVDKEDNIYMSDWNKHCVYKFNKRGDLLKRFGRNGSGPKELDNPQGIAVAGDQVFVCDRLNNRVQVLTTELEPVKQIAGNEHFNRPEDVAVDNEQMVYITVIIMFKCSLRMVGLFAWLERKEVDKEICLALMVCVSLVLFMLPSVLTIVCQCSLKTVILSHHLVMVTSLILMEYLWTVMVLCMCACTVDLLLYFSVLYFSVFKISDCLDCLHFVTYKSCGCVILYYHLRMYIVFIHCFQMYL